MEKIPIQRERGRHAWSAAFIGLGTQFAGGAVKRVANYRVSNRRQVHADLMGPARLD